MWVTGDRLWSGPDATPARRRSERGWGGCAGTDPCEALTSNNFHIRRRRALSLRVCFPRRRPTTEPTNVDSPQVAQGVKPLGTLIGSAVKRYVAPRSMVRHPRNRAAV